MAGKQARYRLLPAQGVVSNLDSSFCFSFATGVQCEKRVIDFRQKSNDRQDNRRTQSHTATSEAQHSYTPSGGQIVNRFSRNRVCMFIANIRPICNVNVAKLRGPDLYQKLLQSLHSSLCWTLKGNSKIAKCTFKADSTSTLLLKCRGDLKSISMAVMLLKSPEAYDDSIEGC